MAHGRGSRMLKGWLGFGGSSLDFTANSTLMVQTVDFTGPGTILRMLWEYVISPISAAAITADDSALLTVGVGIVSTDAATLGFTAMPDPFDDADYPWLYWRGHAMHYRIAGATAADSSGISGDVRVSVDVKSMRKIKSKESLVIVG